MSTELTGLFFIKKKERLTQCFLVLSLVVKQNTSVICEIEDFVEAHLFKVAWNTSIARIYYKCELCDLKSVDPCNEEVDV